MAWLVWFGVNAIVAAIAYALGWHVHKARQERRQDAAAWLDGIREQPDGQRGCAVHRDASGRPALHCPCDDDRPPRIPARTAAMALPAFTMTLPTAAVAGRPPWEVAARPSSSPAARQRPSARRQPPPPDGPTPIEQAAREAVQARQAAAPSSSPPPPDDDPDIGPVTAGNLLNAETVGFLRRLALDDQLYRASVGLPPGRPVRLVNG